MCIPGPVPGHGAEETTSAWRSGAEAEGEEGASSRQYHQIQGRCPICRLLGEWLFHGGSLYNIVHICTHKDWCGIYMS